MVHPCPILSTNVKLARIWFSARQAPPILTVDEPANNKWGSPMNRSALSFALILTLIVSTSATAAVFSGRVGVSSYLWERSELDSTDTRHWQNSGTLGLRLGRIAGNDIELATTMRGRLDSRSQGDNVDDYRVYDFYARWRKIARALDVTVGRHRLSWANRSVGIDGGSAELRFWKGWEVGGYIGSLAPEDGRFKSTDFDEGHAVGARLGHRCKTMGTMYLTFSEKRIARSYGETEVDNLASRDFSLDWRKSIVSFGSVYGHLMYDEPRMQISRAHLSARWDATPTVSVQGQYRFRRPSLAYNSIFWVFGGSEYREGRLRLYVKVNPVWTLTVGGALVDIGDDDAQRIDLGVSHKYVSLMLMTKSGASGATTALSGDVMYPLNDLWTLRGGSHYSNFELIEDQEESSMEASVWAGVRWQWMPQSTWDLEAQYLTQDLKTMPTFAGDESDFRLIARFSWWFFNRIGAQN